MRASSSSGSGMVGPQLDLQAQDMPGGDFFTVGPDMEPILAACDRLALPLCLFDENAAPLWANASARALAGRQIVRTHRGGTALFTDLQRRLKHQIGAARSWPGDRIEAAVEGLTDTVLELVRILDGNSLFVIGLFLRKAPGERTQRQRQFARYGLTATECWIAEQMLAGRTTAEITGANKTTIHTVRTHIKHIYTKLDVHCREKMLAKLQSP